jgi:hypothetical protein
MASKLKRGKPNLIPKPAYNTYTSFNLLGSSLVNNDDIKMLRDEETRTSKAKKQKEEEEESEVEEMDLEPTEKEVALAVAKKNPIARLNNTRKKSRSEC